MQSLRSRSHWVQVSDLEEFQSLLECLSGRCHTLNKSEGFGIANLAVLPSQIAVAQLETEAQLELTFPGRSGHLLVFSAPGGGLVISHAGGTDNIADGQSVVAVDCRHTYDIQVASSGPFQVARLDVASAERRLSERIGASPDGGLSFNTPVIVAARASLTIHSMLQAFVQCARDAIHNGFLEEALISMQRSIIDVCLVAFSGCQHAAFDKFGERRIIPRHVRRAVQYMQQNAHRIKSIEEVAQAVLTSRRSLEMGFNRYLQVTPANYLREIRLERARAELLDPAQVSSVSAIANRWGFLHLGLFSRRYRIAYGELPSVTLSRRP